MNKILVAVDGSQKSLSAAKKVASMFDTLKADITIITILQDVESTVYDVPYGTTSTMSVETMQELVEQNKEKAKDRGQKIVNLAASYFEDLGMNIKKTIHFGDPANIICEYAEDYDCDMIVLADKGLGGVKRFLLGSISDKVVRHAKTSVLVVK
ncbi:MAG: universal stress protein [Halanaerobiales bacterium]|nr:universal stress protein [Halanaerobiales bacterium]